METTNKLSQILPLLFVFALLMVGIVSAVASNPSQPTDITVLKNSTNVYPNGTMLNGTRGYIYYILINESQPTQKWIGYVGNISAEYALQDASSNALYDWEIVTTTGEIYATKEGALGSGNNYESASMFAGGIPVWADLTCANSSMLATEESLFNHTASDEDAYRKTFKTTSFNNPGFFAGENEILDNDCVGGCTDCSGAHLNQNNADEPAGGNWTTTLLTDLSYQAKSAGENTIYHYDITYATLIENNSVGFDGNTYDFQIMLPQSGLQGDQSNVAFYFYIELI